MATDTLSAVAALLQPESGKLEHRLTAQFPLLRSTIEASATALWLLRPDDQRTRIVRLLQLRWTDIAYDLRLAKSAAAVKSSMDKTQVSTAQQGIRTATRRKKTHLERIGLVAVAEGIPTEEFHSGAPGLERIITEAVEDDGRSATIWRVISGLSHPSPLRFLQTSRAETQSDNGDGTLHVLSSMNFQNTTVALMCAMLLCQQATEFRTIRMLRPCAGTSSDSSCWAAAHNAQQR